MTRIGTFSSSSIWKLMSKGKKAGAVGKPFNDYVQDKIYEVRTGVEMQKESNARPLAWGNLIEEVAFSNLKGATNANELPRYTHPTLPWTGRPDHLYPDTVGDIKSPWTPKSFCILADILMSENIGEKLKIKKPEYYWQLVSNSILTGLPNCELAIYIPYKFQLPFIRELASQQDEEIQNKFAFIHWASDEELPHIIKGKYYKQMYIGRFTPPEEDKKALIARVEMASEMLN